MDVKINAALACRSKTEYRAAVARDLQPEYRAQTCADYWKSRGKKIMLLRLMSNAADWNQGLLRELNPGPLAP